MIERACPLCGVLPLSPLTDYTAHVRWVWNESAPIRDCGRGRFPLHPWQWVDYIPCLARLAPTTEPG